MTSFGDNIYSGNAGPTSAKQSKSPVVLRRTHYFTNAAPAVGSTQTGTLPPNSENVRATLYITTPGSATVSDKITVSANGLDMVTFSQFGSAQGIADQTLTSVATVTVNASALAAPIADSPAANGGETTYSVTFLPSSASRSTAYRVVLTFNRADQHFQN